MPRKLQSRMLCPTRRSLPKGAVTEPTKLCELNGRFEHVTGTGGGKNFCPPPNVGVCGTRQVQTCDGDRWWEKLLPDPQVLWVSVGPGRFEHVTGTGGGIKKLGQPQKVFWVFVGPGRFEHVTGTGGGKTLFQPRKNFWVFVGPGRFKHVMGGEVVEKKIRWPKNNCGF